MADVFTRALARRGIYTGSYRGKTMGGALPRPAMYLIVNRGGNSMVRLEVGFGKRSAWIDWGKQPES